MGYPVWTHTSDKYQARAMREGEENKLSSENSELRKENEALKARNKELEDENKNLKKYIDSLKC
jgi:cell division protein FtsB